MRYLASICVLTAVWIALVSCNHKHKSGEAKTQSTSDAASKSVDTIALPHYQTTFPPGPGRDAFAVGCLSCHSTRYVTMQPPLTAAKWEESVRKMIKTYSAPIAEDQVQPIVQYLMAAKENGEPGSWETPVVVTPAVQMSAKLTGGDLAHGKQLYAERCASCHGQTGTADTPAAQTMLPRPTDLTSGWFAKGQIESAILHGVRGTAMPGYPGLSPSDVTDLVEYTAKLSPGPEAPRSPPVDFTEARALYTKNCASCHGADGLGNGIAAPPLSRTPASFWGRLPSSAQAARVIADGVPGTAMPAWKSRLTEPQRLALAEYVRQFYFLAQRQER